MPLRDFREIGLDHRARRRVDRGLARLERQSGSRNRADALAGLEAQSGAWAREAHGRHDERAMGDVRIVARVLDDAGAGKIGPKLMGRERKFGPEALRQRDRNGVRESASQKRFEGRARRAARAGAGRPPAPEGGFFGSLMSAGLARDAHSPSGQGTLGAEPGHRRTAAPTKAAANGREAPFADGRMARVLWPSTARGAVGQTAHRKNRR